MIDEGYVKYNCTWIEDISPERSQIVELNRWRHQLYQLGLIGQYENGIGFGNLSIRGKLPKEIIISGTNTGGIPQLKECHYTKVIDYSWQENRVSCRGAIAASSETLTHAAIYEANLNTNAVIHIHDRRLWENLLGRVPTTRKNIAYGTPEMAAEIIRLCQEDRLEEQQILVMSGHEEGIITFGKNLDKAGNLLLKYYL
jgi:ribulose-5-phosphate 4-epimerase/fuculose-1-phosphate aldolase